MSYTTCRVHFIRRNGKSIYASNELYRQLKLSSHPTVRLALGKKKIRTPVKRINRAGKHLYVPLTIRALMRIPRMGQSFVMSREGEVKLGPLIGIMTSSAKRSADRPFGSRTPLIRTFLRAGSKKAFCFAFHPSDIDWNNETVLAYFLDDNGKWQKKTVPLPDVIYNRLPSRKAEKSYAIVGLKERFVRRNIPVFNWSFFDKWDVYELLQNDPEASAHVPESYIDPSPEQIRDLLEKHHFIYLKPTAGSLGIGIYRLTYHKSNGYFIRFRRGGRNVLLRFKKFSSLLKMLGHSRGRMKNYVAQQGIRLIELNGSPIDFRFHMNKNGNNVWVVGGIGAKRAGKGSVTTHVRTGGQVMAPEVALSRIYGPDKARSVLQEARETAVKLARAIERNYPYRIGELGFDLGIDKNGKIWMFEANAKPGRSIFKHPSLRAQGKETLSLIFEHCLYLARFRRDKGDD